MFKRLLAAKLKQQMQSFPIVVLNGPRQSGKTTLVRHLFPKFEYVLLEAPDVLLEVKNDPRQLLSRKVRGWIFDEAQRYPELFSYLQEYVDGPNRRPVVLTGSQSFLLSEKISQSLAGRAAVLELLPLSFPELQTNPKWANMSLFDYAFQGTYPRPYQETIPTEDWYQSYIQTYLERDVRQISQVGDLAQFQRFLRLCAGRVGQILNLESLAADCGVSQPTATRWLSILESSRIVFRLHPHFKNFRKRLVKRPKLYFYDSSLVCGLLGIRSATELETHASRGSIFEGLVLSEICKFFFHQGRQPPLYFWRDHRGREVDALIDLAGKLTAVEIKSGQTIASDFVSGLKKWQEISKVPTEQLALVYGGEKRKMLDQITIFGWQEIADLCELVAGPQ